MSRSVSSPTILGYVAASGKLDVFRKANAANGQVRAADTATRSAEAATPACCSEGVPKGQLVAMADPKVKAAVASAEAQGKKPNIVFIMGDDIGMWNIGAYHRGPSSITTLAS